MKLASSLYAFLPAVLVGKQPPYDAFPAAYPPYSRVRYDATTTTGELIYPVNSRSEFPRT